MDNESRVYDSSSFKEEGLRMGTQQSNRSEVELLIKTPEEAWFSDFLLFITFDFIEGELWSAVLL